MKNILFFIISIIAVWGLSFLSYSIFVSDEKITEEKNDSIFVKYDTIRDTVIVKKPVPFFRDTGTYKLIRLPSDTAAILKALNRLNELRVYKRSIVNNDSLQVAIIDTVQYNELRGAAVTYAMNKKTVTITKTITRTVNPNYTLLIGASVTFTDRPVIAPSVGVQIGRNQVFLSATDKIFMVSYNYQIFKR